MQPQDQLRAISLCKELIERIELDLTGLTILTECASGSYACTALIARMAGARVYAYGQDSTYGTFAENKALLQSLMQQVRLPAEGLTAINALSPEVLRDVDILTNSGLLRPICREVIQQLKPTAVIPLMWESWEFRAQDLDLQACQERGVIVIGTNEHFPPTDMYPYPGMIALKLLLDIGIEVQQNELVLIGGNLTGTLIAQTFEQLNISFDWFTSTGEDRAQRCYPFETLPEILGKPYLDAVLCAEVKDACLLAGPGGFLDFDALARKHPAVRWAHLCGNIDVQALAQSGLFYYPQQIRPFGYMSYGTWNIGIRPVIQLNAAGLKVGEIVARARLSGASIESAILQAIHIGIGQDFLGGFLNYGR